MKASEAQLLEMLRQAQQFEIPLYQRQYSWTVEECQTLWDDVVRAGSSELINAHFIGSVVHISKGLSNLTSHEPLLVIDGQQRLTSTSLLLKALALAIKELPPEAQEPADGFSPTKIAKRYLINDDEADHRRYKLILTQTDKDTLCALVDDNPMPNEVSVRIHENFSWFKEQLEKFTSKGNDLAIVCRGLQKLMVVDIALNRDQENPQLIFESMNSTGKELSQADLIRNFVLMGLEPSLQSKLYKNYWRPMELAFGQEAYTQHFDPFVRHYLTIKANSIPKKNAIYEAFKTFAKTQLPDSPAEATEALEALLADLRMHAEYYCAIALGNERDPKLRAAFADIAELRMDVAYPVLLELYADYEQNGLISKSELLTAVRTVEAYVFRRAVCSIPTASMNKTFATFMRQLDKTNYLASFNFRLASLKSYKRFPDDAEFETQLQSNDSYHFLRRLYLLRKLENVGRKEPVSIVDYTIEHVMPQNPKLSEAWQQELGPEWSRIQSEHLHTLGNLTLTGYNSEYSDKAFADKKSMAGGFDSSPLKLNESVRSESVWNEAAILRRGQTLTAQAVKVWARPYIAPELSTQIDSRPVSAYSLEDHPGLAFGPWAGIYTMLKAEVLALDPSIVEDIKKQVISFTANRAFMDVYATEKRLVIQARVPFQRLDDPHGICQDISMVGHWGVGNLRMHLTSADELPRIMGIIRQAFDNQLDDDPESDAASEGYDYEEALVTAPAPA